MNIITKAIVVLALAVLVCGIIYVAICAAWFVLQELNHSFKNFKRTMRNGLWALEWRMGYNKRHNK